MAGPTDATALWEPSAQREKDSNITRYMPPVNPKAIKQIEPKK